MPRVGVNEDQVRHAKAALEERGVTATYRAIRTELGQGSFATIQQHLRAIRASETVREGSVNGLPATLKQRIEEFGDAIWRDATAIAMTELADIKSAYNARSEALETELSEALAAIEALEEDLERREAELGEAQTQLTTLVDTVRRHEVLLTESTRRESEATRRFEEYVSRLDKSVETLSKAVNASTRRIPAKFKAKADQN